MFRSHVAVQIALLRESASADRTDELGLHAALVLLMTPQRREEGVDAVALRAHVLLLQSLLVVVVQWLPLVRLAAFIALKRFVPHQRGLQGEGPAAIVAEILTGTCASGPAVVDRGHRAQPPGVHGDARGRRQRG